MVASTVDAPAEPRERAWFGHPRGLTILFLTEMWSDFSYFGMRTLLVYYMTQQLLISQPKSSVIYGLYTSFYYFTPLLGGAVSDRWLGRRRAVLLGAAIMAAGHFMMAFEATFYLALATIAIGNGLFLPSLPGQINSLYHADDPRRASAYNIYYVGVNFGSFFAPFACGTIGELWGWNWGFTVAGVGMVAGLIVYIVGSPLLPPDNRPTRRAESVPASPTSHGEKLGRNTLLLLVAIELLVIVYRSVYEQVGNTVALWAASGVDRTVGGWTIPMTWFQSLNPLGIFLLTPVVVSWWTRRAGKGKDQSELAKMGIGALALAAAFLVLAGASLHAAAANERASWLWLALYFFVFTAGELFILPVGLGLFGRLAPARHTATMIAAWFAAAFFGNLGAGLLGALWSAMPPHGFFALIAAIATCAGALLLALVPWARAICPRAHGGRDSEAPGGTTIDRAVERR